MSLNKEFIRSLGSMTPSELGPVLDDEVEWVEWVDGVPASGAITRGREAFIKNYGDDELHGQTSRMIEEGNVVVEEGSVLVQKKDGRSFRVQYCNIYEVKEGKVKRKSSYGALIKDSA
jgi:ketosteroid isomerase-like protein